MPDDWLPDWMPPWSEELVELTYASLVIHEDRRAIIRRLTDPPLEMPPHFADTFVDQTSQKLAYDRQLSVRITQALALEIGIESSDTFRGLVHAFVYYKRRGANVETMLEHAHNSRNVIFARFTDLEKMPDLVLGTLARRIHEKVTRI